MFLSGLFKGSKFAQAMPRFVSFRGHKKLEPRPDGLLWALNSKVPTSIPVYSIWKPPPGMNSIKLAEENVKASHLKKLSGLKVKLKKPPRVSHACGNISYIYIYIYIYRSLNCLMSVAIFCHTKQICSIK